MLAAHPVLGLRGELLDRRAAQPAHEVQVVRREILDDADVAHAAGERPDALGRDEEHLAELAVLDAAAQLEQRGVAALDEADGGADAGRLAEGDDLATLVDRRRERLLDQQVDAGRGEVAHRRDVVVGRHRDHREIRDAGGEERVDRGVHERRVADGAVAVAAGVDGPGEAHAGRALEQPRVVAAHHAEAQDGPAQDRSVGGHGHRSH